MVLYRFTISVVLLSVFLLPEYASAEESLENCLLIHNAQISLPAHFDDATFGHANYGHEIKAGNRSVILIRTVWNLRGPIDSQKFSKTTLELERLPSSADIGQAKKLNVLHSYHSEGVTAFIDYGHYLWAQGITRKILIIHKPSGLNLEIDTKFTQRSAGSGKERSARLKVSCGLHEMSFDDFSANAGKPGTNWSSFYSVDK